MPLLDMQTVPPPQQAADAAPLMACGFVVLLLLVAAGVAALVLVFIIVGSIKFAKSKAVSEAVNSMPSPLKGVPPKDWNRRAYTWEAEQGAEGVEVLGEAFEKGRQKAKQDRRRTGRSNTNSAEG